MPSSLLRPVSCHITYLPCTFHPQLSYPSTIIISIRRLRRHQRAGLSTLPNPPRLYRVYSPARYSSPLPFHPPPFYSPPSALVYFLSLPNSDLGYPGHTSDTHSATLLDPFLTMPLSSPGISLAWGQYQLHHSTQNLDPNHCPGLGSLPITTFPPSYVCIVISANRLL